MFAFAWNSRSIWRGIFILDRLDAGLERHIRVDALSLERVWIADHRRFGDIGMRHQCAFHFGGAKPMARYVDDVVNPSGDPLVAISVAIAAIPGVVLAFELAEVLLTHPVRVAIHVTHLSGP